eukprot:2446110-Rhodomonas_salina.3
MRYVAGVPGNTRIKAPSRPHARAVRQNPEGAPHSLIADGEIKHKPPHSRFALYQGRESSHLISPCGEHDRLFFRVQMASLSRNLKPRGFKLTAKSVPQSWSFPACLGPLCVHLLLPLLPCPRMPPSLPPSLLTLLKLLLSLLPAAPKLSRTVTLARNP